MLRGNKPNRRNDQTIWGILAVLAILFVVSFRAEIGAVWTDLTGQKPPGPAPAPGQVSTPTAKPSSSQPTPTITPTPAPVVVDNRPASVSFIFFNCLVGFWFIFFLWIGVVSFQALLPITNILSNPMQALLEVYRTGFHLILHMLQVHGPAIFVTDGVQNTTNEDLQREGHGVIVVDFNSAVVLEELHEPPGINGLIHRLWLGLLSLLLLVDPRKSPRVGGPGIIFTRPRERISGVVDLRKQFRMQMKVPCYTRDGIELTANVLSLFTVGQRPDIIQVVYEGEERPDNLRVVTVEEMRDGYLRISRISDDLDAADKAEIHAYARQFRPKGQGGARASRVGLEPYSKVDDTTRQEYDEQRVFAAVVARARTADRQELDWTELPTRVAAGLYRELLLTVNYDDLYALRGEGQPFPLPQYKSQLSQTMRNNGILAFRMLYHKDYSRRGFVAGDSYHPSSLLVSGSSELTNSRVLRDRGIKVIMSGFSNPSPVNPEVYRQRLDSWKASWAHEFEISMAEHELAAARAGSRAYAVAQQDLWRSLSMIFSQQMGEEALALRIFQTLDLVAADPKTQTLLPQNAIELMRHLSTVLLPGDTAQKQIPPPVIDHLGAQQ